MDLFTLILGFTVTILMYALFKTWKINSYWLERGVAHIKPILFFGNTTEFGRISNGELVAKICDKFPNESYVGYYNFTQPILLVKDIDLIEKILIKDFMHFIDHGLEIDAKKNPFDTNIFFLSGRRWKAIRSKISPLFTTGKLKMMFDSMKQCGDELVNQLDSVKDKEIEMRDYFGRFATDVIGSSAFGIDPGTLVEPNNQFSKMAKKAFEMNWLRTVKFIIVITFTPLAKFFNMSFNRKDVQKYFCSIIGETLKQRRNNNYKRNDFVQLMMQLQEKGYVEIHTKDEADDYLNIEPTYSTWKFEMSDEELTGHAFSCLTAGFDSLQLTMLYALYEFSKHPEIQEKVREEVISKMERSDTMTYDTIKEMTYLEQCVKETLRMYPPTSVLMRSCTKEYNLPNGTKIEHGQKIWIPMRTIHFNPNYFPDPQKFQPERFAPDQNLHPCAFLTFGNGPRICIAMRFAILEVKYCLAKLLLNFRFTINSKTEEPLRIDPQSIFAEPKQKILFNITKLSAA